MARHTHARRTSTSARSRARAGRRSSAASRTRSRISGRPLTSDLVRRLTHLSLETRALLAILAGALLLRILPLGAFSTEYDEGVYWLSLRSMAQGHALYGSIYYAQPPFFLLGIYPIFVLLGQTLPAARFAVTLFSLVGIAALYVVGRRLAGRYVGLAAALLLAVDPLYLRVSRTLEAEAPALALMLVGIALAVEALPRSAETGRMRQVLIVASGAALGLAVMTKLYAAVGIVPVALLLGWPQLHSAIAPPPSRTSRRRRAARISVASLALPITGPVAWPELGLLLAGLVGAVAIVLLPFLGNIPALYAQVVGLHLEASRMMSRGLGYNVQLIAGRAGELGISYWLVLAALVAIGVAVWRHALVAIPVGAWALASLVLLLAQQPLFAHHVALLVPPLALLSALLVRLAQPLPARRSLRRAHATTGMLRALRQPTVATYAMLILLGATVVVNLIGAAHDDQAAIEHAAPDDVLMALTLATASVAGEPVATDDPYLAGLAGRSLPPGLIDTSLVRIHTGNLTAAQVEATLTTADIHTILFASGRFDAVPGLRAWVQQHYTVGKDFGAGRVLYVKQPQGPVFT